VTNVESFNRQKACRHGELLYNRHDQHVGRALDQYGEYSEGEIDLFRQIVQPDATVVEVGAGIGAHTVFLARQVAPGGFVVAFEPQRLLYQTLCANLALNSITNVYCFLQAVGAQRGSIVVPALDPRRASNFGRVPLGSHASGEQVPLCRLDDLNLPACQFLKIDVEGMETDVLDGARDTIARCQPVLYVANEKPEKAESLVRLIDGLSYRLYWHRPPYFSPKNFFGNTKNLFPNAVALKMICFHHSVGLNLQGLEPVDVRPAGPAAL
jgi:FkbM family methyltransferase